MNRQIKLLLLPVLLALSVNLFAGAGSGDGTITDLYVNAKGTMIRVHFSKPIVNPDGCDKADYYMLELDPADNNNPFVSFLLSAHVSQTTVWFWISGCTSGAYWGGTHPQLHEVFLK